MLEIKVVRAIILNEHKEVLLGERAQGHGRGLMELPGGKVDPGEEPIDAVVREVREEMGLIFAPTMLFRENIDFNRGIAWRNAYYYGDATGDLLLDPEEVASARYVAKNELVVASFKMPFGQKDHLLEFLQTHAK